MKHKKILAAICAIALIICFFVSLPEEQMSAESAGDVGDVSGVYIDADYSTCTLTAVLTDADGNEVELDSASSSSVSYAWYKSTTGEENSYSEITDETGSTYSSFLDGCYYYVTVEVTGTGSATYTSAAKHISTEIESVKIQNDIYRDGVFTALLLNSEGDVLYYDDDGNSSVPTATPTDASAASMTTYNKNVTYTWYRYSTAATIYVYTDAATPATSTGYEEATETTSNNTLTPTMGAESYYYYVKVSIDENTSYSSDPRIATIYTGITVEIEQVKNNDGTITLNMVVYDDNGDVMLNDDGSYYYNDAYTTTWYKSKEYFASEGDDTTADTESEVTTSSSVPLGYAPQDYYQESNYMRVSNAAASDSNTNGYTNSITVTGEVGRYYYVDINKNKTNGTAEAGASPVFVRNCTSTVVIEDDIATDGTFKAVIYDGNGGQVTDTSSYTFTWYKTVSGTTKYKGLADATGTSGTFKTSEEGRFVSSYYAASYGAYYSDSGCFNRDRNVSTKISEYSGTSMDKDNVTEGTYALVRENFSEELAAVSNVFADANYSFDTSGSGDTFALNDGVTDGTAYNDGSSCNVATDEGQLRYYYVVVSDGNSTYTSAVKYVKYSNQIENGGFQDNGTSTQYDSSLVPYWQTTNMGYTDSSDKLGYPEKNYRLRPLIEMSTYISSTSYTVTTYGNYYAFPGLSYDKENIAIETTSSSVEVLEYLELAADENSTDTYVFRTNQFCEINSTDNNTLYQTVMTVPDMPLYWSLSHRARTGSGTKITLDTDTTVYQDSESANVALSSLGVASGVVYVAIDIMYVVIMDETDAEELLSNGETLEEQQAILNSMIKSITSGTGTEKQSSKDGSSYMVRYDGSYTYPESGGTTYSNISIWRVQTGSTAVLLTFETGDNAKTNAEAAAKNKDLLKYYAETYGTVKSYSYSTTSNSVTTYYTAFYTESQAYSDSYNIPSKQYVSRYFFVAGSSSNTSTGYSGNLSFGSYENESGETVSSYNGVEKATNTSTAGNFIDNIVFTQQLTAEIRYWVYEYDETNKSWGYVLKETEKQTGIKLDDKVTPDTETESGYSDKYYFVGSYVSKEGGDGDTPSEEDLGTDKYFTADTNVLVMDLYYEPYEVSIDKEIVGLPNNMDYEDFKDSLQITIYALTDNGSSYTKAETPVVGGKYLAYAKDNNTNEESLTYTTVTDNIRLEKGTYLISETTDMLLLDSFDGWYSVEMSLKDGTVLTYDETLGGFILTVGEESDEADGDEDATIEISLVNTYKPIAVEAVKSVLLGETDVSSINAGLGSTDASTDTSLKYQSLTEYDNALRGVDDTDETSDETRVAVLSGDTLTYRMELTSGGRADSKDIEVTDIVPSGCTLLPGSIMILKQTRAENTSSYGVVTTVLTSSGTSTSTTGNETTWTATVDSDIFTIKYNSSTGEITWIIPKMASNEQYYVEYAVTVDNIPSSTERALLTNTAAWSYISEINSGATNDTSTTVEATMAMTKTEDSGTTTYTVTFSDLGNYTVTVLKDTLPDGFVIDTSTIKINDTSLSDLTSYTVTYYDSDGSELTGTLGTDFNASDIVSFKVSYDNGISQSNGAITLTFSGTQGDIGDADDEIRNMAGITYTKSGESTQYTSIIASGYGVTNQVETDVTHIYLEVEKDIVSDADLTVDSASTDTEQSFLFMVEYYAEGKTVSVDDPDSISYVTINCSSGTGSRLLQADKRGTYVITEVTDWSATDYDYVSASLDGDSVTGESVTVDYTSSGTYLNENGSLATTLGLLNGTHAVAAFYNTESLYAYRSGSAYAKNKMSN